MTPAFAADDLLSTDAYGLVRARYRDRIIELKRRRRVAVGLHVSVLFESRETVLYHIQEMLWIERPVRPERVEEEVAEYDRLIPRAGELTATLMIQGGPWRAGQALIDALVAGHAVVLLVLGARRVAAELLSPVHDPSCPVQYLRFPLDRDAARALLERSVDVHLGVHYAGRIETVALPRETVDELARGLGVDSTTAARAPMLSSVADLR
ncbi:DUF3501 family protein [Sorangium sp. So ce1097]|uniref:DUF3501 family protein n=1 Tax=Sorangium sp. So ce1097 TaxID=3133330 RepID=UPI003F631FF2